MHGAAMSDYKPLHTDLTHFLLGHVLQAGW
jgi:hypothetical protein